MPVSGLERVINSLYRILKPINSVASSAGMGCLAAMMFLTAADVLLRYLFNKPIMGSYELIQYMMVITITVGLACCGLGKGHVTLDALTSRLPRRTRAIIDSIVGLLSLIIVLLITRQTCIYITTLQKSQLTSTVLLIPVYPFVAIVAFGVAFFCVVLMLHFLEFILEGMRK
jgi:TRAP-type C4-dicarboxylate transport system permease small subunit